MLPETGRGTDPDSCEALPLAQRICLTVEQYPFQLPHQLLQVTVSAGISIRDPHAAVALDSATLFKRADEQLYRAKRAGRNRCAFPERP